MLAAMLAVLVLFAVGAILIASEKEEEEPPKIHIGKGMFK